MDRGGGVRVPPYSSNMGLFTSGTNRHTFFSDDNIRLRDLEVEFFHDFLQRSLA